MVFSAFRPTARALSTSVAWNREVVQTKRGQSAPKKRATPAARRTVQELNQMKKIMVKKQADTRKSLESIKKVEARIKAQDKKDREEKKRLDALAARAKKQLQAARPAAPRRKPATVTVRKTEAVRIQQYRATYR